MQDLEARPRVYLDTSAVDRVFDAFNSRRVGAAALKQVWFAVSSCQLDEIVPIRRHGRRKQLASFLWQFGDRQKLLDSVELVALEIGAALDNRVLVHGDHVDRPNKVFDTNFRLLKNGTISEDWRLQVTDRVMKAKEAVKGHIREERERFKCAADAARELERTKPWREYLREMRDEGRMQQMLWNFLESDPYSSYEDRFDRDDVLGTNYQLLRCTRVGLEYVTAVRWLAAWETGDIARPELGDQADYRHAFYAGLCDWYVTADKRMYQILTEFVQGVSADVMFPGEMLERIRALRNATPE